MEILPEIRSSSEICGYLTFPPLDGVPISGVSGPLFLVNLLLFLC